MYHWLLLLTFVINTAEIYVPRDPGEVNTTYNFTCAFRNNADFIYWSKDATNIVSCYEPNCTILVEENKNIYEVTRSNQNTALKIKTVTTKSGGNYSCNNENEFFNFSLQVYAKPDMVTCQDPEFQRDTNEVAVVGTVLGVYPIPICQFSWFFNDTMSRIIKKSMVEYNNLTGSGKPDYFNQRCSFKVPARNFTRGKHQFQLLAYPDVTGQVNDTAYGKYSSQTSPKYVADPIVTLECSETTVQEDKPFNCTCKEIANTFILLNTTLFYGGSKLNSAIQQVTANFTANRNSLEAVCQAQLPDGTTANKTQTVQVYFGPNIFVLKANNNSGKIILVENSSMSISCQAEGNPSPSLSLTMDGTEIQPVNVSNHKSNQTLTYNKAMAECLDTGVYTCHAETGQAVTDKTVAVYVKCAQQFRDPGILSQSYKEQVNGTVLINVPIFGYPEPTVTLNSNKHRLSSKSYTLNYTKQEPPYGTVSVVINIRNTSYFQNYTLNINNTEGALTYSFEIVEGVTLGSEKVDSPALDVGAIVGGIVAAVLVIVIIFVIVYLVKRKGAPCKGRKDQNPNNSMHSIYGIDDTVTVDNAALYNMGEKSEEVVIDNSDLYNMNKTVTIDNSDLYNLNRTSQEVEVDNSDLYNMNRPTPGIVARNSDYKNYSDVVPTITSATSVPLNMRNKEREDTSNPYEDVSSGNKNKPKPTAAPKPKPVAKPKPQAGKQVDQQARNTPPDQTYAMVVKLPNSDKTFAIKEDKDDFFLDPSQQPEVPEKNFENPYEDTQNEKSTEKKLSDKKKNKADKPNGKASEQHKDPSSLAYANKGFTSPDDDVNVYANT